MLLVPKFNGQFFPYLYNAIYCKVLNSILLLKYLKYVYVCGTLYKRRQTSPKANFHEISTVSNLFGDFNSCRCAFERKDYVRWTKRVVVYMVGVHCGWCDRFIKSLALCLVIRYYYVKIIISSDIYRYSEKSILKEIILVKTNTLKI
ncbi:hypothetical protein FWK35_00010671 [Aphis craccivora]|uniref:Uncharacterized protein n=1 Tax=Aphis craccivora TaxID=307492 RepID=A0A6G0ZGC5_APHCR|nr:hypothetical protein FWK35_00010671 [Aphis craccivora]